MKKFEFPYGGTLGPGDSWDSYVEYELTDEEAERLVASARVKPRWRLNEDPNISDICEKIENYIFEENKRMMIEDGRLEEERETWEYDHEDESDDEIPTDDELVDEAMGIWHVNYPEELQDLEEDQEE